MRISIFGIGYVGVVAAACLARDGHEVVAVDVNSDKVDDINAGRCPIVENGLPELIETAHANGRLRATLDPVAAVLETDVSFICVGTPSDETGAVGLKYVTAAAEDVGRGLAQKEGFHSVVVRSTIVPGSTEEAAIPALERVSGKTCGTDFGLGYYPEFLREGTAIEDYDKPGLIVIGALDDATRGILTELNSGLGVEPHLVDIKSAELAKYSSNCWRAVKISFANEIGNLAKSAGLDGAAVMRILCSDTQIAMSPAFLRPGFAFGGSCLPKDLRALRHFGQTNGVQTPMLNATLEANDAQIERAEHLVLSTGAERVGLVGVAFKSDTDDLRESPLAALAGRLLNKGVDVAVFDPFVSEAYRTAPAHAGRGNTAIPDLQDRLVPSLEDLVDRSKAIVIGNTYSSVKDRILSIDGLPVVDLARIDPLRRSGGSYEGLCW